MTRIIVHEILSAVFLNLLYTSIHSDGSRLYPEFIPLVGKSFKLVCKAEGTIVSTITIKFPDGTIAGTCDPAVPLFPVDCVSAVGYVSALNQTEHAITISTNSLASYVNGTWTCTYIAESVSYNLLAPIREIRDMTFTLFPTSFTENITSETASFSLSVTYGCINLPVYFKWFVVDSVSNKIDIDIDGTNNAVENSSVCTSLSGFNGYTETKEVNEDVYSSNYVKGLVGSYQIGVEVHYMDEATTLHSIKYFDTYFVFSPSTTTAPIIDATNPVKINDGSKENVKDRNIGIGVGIPALIAIIIIIIIIVLVKKRGNKRDNAKTPKQNNSNKTWEPTVNKPDTPENTAMQHSKPWDHAVNTSGNPEHVYMKNDHHVDYDRRHNSGKLEHISMPSEYHVDYNRRNNFGNPEHEPLPRLPPADYDRRNNSGKPEHVSMPSEYHVDYNKRNNSGIPEYEPVPRLPPADYDRKNDHASHF